MTVPPRRRPGSDDGSIAAFMVLFIVTLLVLTGLVVDGGATIAPSGGVHP